MIRKGHVMMLCDFETTGLPEEMRAFPIEIGALFLVNEYEIIGHYETLIRWEEFDSWSDADWELPAMRINKIDHDIIEKAPLAADVSTEIDEIIKDFRADRVYLASDNPYFDFYFAKKLGLNNLHYNPRGVTHFIESMGLRRPEGKQKAHRGMNDVMNLYRSLVMAYQISKGIRS